MNRFLQRMLIYYGSKLRLSRRARSTFVSSSGVIEPRRRRRRDFSTVMTCSHFTSVRSVRPFSSLGAIRTCKGSSRSVRLIEATIVKGYAGEAFPRSFWMINAGRVPCCSAPRPGDQFTSHISPRRGLGGPSCCLWLGCVCPGLTTHALCNHTFGTGMEKELSFFKSIWDGTEVGICVIKG